MNILPPPNTDDIKELRDWCLTVWQFLQAPHFEVVRFVPRSAAPTGDFAVEGGTYYDSDDDKLKVHNGTAYQDTY